MTVEDEEELQIEMEAPGEEDGSVVVTPPAPAAKEQPAEPEDPDGIAQLRANLDAEKRRAEGEAVARRAAEERAASVEQAARGQSQNGQLQQVNSAIELLSSRQMQIKRDWSMAMQSGDYDKAADLQADLSEQTAHLTMLKQGKVSLEQQANTPRPQPRPQPVVQHSDPVEAFASSLTPKSASWVRANPDYVRDNGKKAQMLAAHEAAVEDGLMPDSKRYFAFIEDQLGIGQAEAEPVAKVEAKPAIPRRPPVASAPVSRQAPSAPTTPKFQTIKLSAFDRQQARDMGLTDEEMARGKIAAMKYEENLKRGNV